QDLARDESLTLQSIDDRTPRSLRAVQMNASIRLEEKKKHLDLLFGLNNLCVLENDIIDTWRKEGDEFDDVAGKTAAVLATMEKRLKGTEDSIESLKMTVRDHVMDEARNLGFAIEDRNA